MRFAALGALLVPAALIAGCAASGPPSTSDGEAACAAPLTTVAEPTVTPGQVVRVTAEGLWSSCRDHADIDSEGKTHYSDPEPTPLTAQVVTFTQGGTDADLATVGADDAAEVEVDVTIPADAEAGPAEIAVGHLSEPAAVTVVTAEPGRS